MSTPAQLLDFFRSRFDESLVRNLQPFDPRCTLTVEGGLNRPPLERTEAVIALFQKARNLAMELGMDLGEGSTGGGSDGSFTAAMGIPTLDGLGVGGDGAHAVDEHVYVNDIPPRAALLCRLAESIYDSVPAAGPDLFPLRAIGGHSGQRVFRDL